MINPKKAVIEMEDYVPPTSGREDKLRLDFNENTIGCSPKVIASLRNVNANKLSVYPEYSSFTEKLAEYLSVDSNQVMLTDATDEAIKIVMDTFLDKGDEVIIPVPTFAMFKFYASLAEARIKEVLYNNDLSFPTESVLDSISSQTKVVVLVNPNNPTGTSIPEKDIERIVEKAKKNNALVLIDEAYYQFYGKTSLGLIDRYDNVVVIQTFSKAFGLAGIRLGYIVSNTTNMNSLRKAGSPYSVNTLALIAGEASLDDIEFVENYAIEVRKSKEYLKKQLSALGIKVYPSDANFLLADFGSRCNSVCERLKERGVLVRNRTNDSLLKNCIRITVGTIEQSKQLMTAIKGIVGEKVLIFDMDGVLADVSKSYRYAVKLTAEYFIGKPISLDSIQSLKQEGGFNNDWVLTQELVKRNGKQEEFEIVKEKFQELYLGSSFNGLIQKEKLVLPVKFLEQLAGKYRMAIVTGRPKEEADFFLQSNDIGKFFEIVVCKEDMGDREKPDPYGITLALNKLNTKYSEAYYIGDSIDDMIAAVKAGVIPIGVIPPGVSSKQVLKQLLIDNRAESVLDNIKDIMEVLK